MTLGWVVASGLLISPRAGWRESLELCPLCPDALHSCGHGDEVRSVMILPEAVKTF